MTAWRGKGNSAGALAAVTQSRFLHTHPLVRASSALAVALRDLYLTTPAPPEGRFHAAQLS